MNMWRIVYGAYYQLKIPENGKVIIPREKQKPVIIGRTYQDRDMVLKRRPYKIMVRDNTIIAISPQPEYVVVWDGEKTAYKLYQDGRTEPVEVEIEERRHEETITRIRQSKKKPREEWKVHVTTYIISTRRVNVGGYIEFTETRKTKIRETTYKYSEAEKLGLVK